MRRGINIGQGWANPSVASAYAGVDKRTLYAWLADGLPFSRLKSGRVLIRLADIDVYLKTFEVSGKQDKVKNLVDGIMEEVIHGKCT